MPIGTWEPTRSIHAPQQEIPQDDKSWLQAEAPSLAETPVLAEQLPTVGPTFSRAELARPPIDEIDLAVGRYRLGQHTGTLDDSERRDVLAVVARSIVRTLTQEAQRVRELYGAVQQLSQGPQASTMQKGSGELSDMQEVPGEVSQEIAAVEDLQSQGSVYSLSKPSPEGASSLRRLPDSAENQPLSRGGV